MKKILIVLLILALVLAGLFFWKGGHHALFLAGKLDEWLDMDSADQILTVEYQRSDFLLDSTTGQIKQEPEHWTLTADSFWTEHDGERVFGLTAEGITAYLAGKNLYLDTGKAYALPEMPELQQTLERLRLGLLLYGRVTKTGDTYHISMKTDELKLSVALDSALQTISVKAALPDQTVIDVTLTTRDPLSHPIPQAVADAMDLARTEPPMLLTEPLEVLMPAAEQLLPLSGDLKLGVSCGILEVSETVQLELRNGKAALIRKDKRMELPMDLSDLSPVAIAALLLREGDYTQTEDGAVFTVNLPADSATRLLAALVPQAADLGITLGDSALNLYFSTDRLTCATLAAKGSVPFLFTTIPVDFSAELTVS